MLSNCQCCSYNFSLSNKTEHAQIVVNWNIQLPHLPLFILKLVFGIGDREREMAVAASRTDVMVGEDHAVAVKRELIVDPESGMAVQVEKAVVAVDLGETVELQCRRGKG